MSEISKLIAEIKSEGILRAWNKLERLYSLAEQMEADYAALQQKMDAANEKLTRYSMSAGQADQFAAEAKWVRIALGFGEDAQDVAPIDLLEKIAGLRAEGVEMFVKDYAQRLRTTGGAHGHHSEPYKEMAEHVEEKAELFVEQLRSGTHDTANKAG